MVKDVHLCVAKTDKHTDDKDEPAIEGDPVDKNYEDTTGAGMPTGWTYKGVTQRQNADGTSDWCVTWTGPANPLAGPATFSVDYCGGRGANVQLKADKLFLTKGGTNTFNPATDVVKKEKGYIPVFSTAGEPGPRRRLPYRREPATEQKQSPTEK